MHERLPSGARGYFSARAAKNMRMRRLVVRRYWLDFALNPFPSKNYTIKAGTFAKINIISRDINLAKFRDPLKYKVDKTMLVFSCQK